MPCTQSKSMASFSELGTTAQNKFLCSGVYALACLCQENVNLIYSGDALS